MELPILLSNLSAVTGPSSVFKYSCFRLLERNTQLKQNPKKIDNTARTFYIKPGERSKCKD
jgi:hypothetical protein